MIDFLGATKVESFDNSDYEQATHIADMNLPIEGAETYDTVLDAGTLEHIYKWHRLSKLCQRYATGAVRFFTYCQLTINAVMRFGSLRRNCSIRFILEQTATLRRRCFQRPSTTRPVGMKLRHRAMVSALLSSQFDLSTFSVGRQRLA